MPLPRCQFARMRLLRKTLRVLLPDFLITRIKMIYAWFYLKTPFFAKTGVGEVAERWRSRIDDVKASPDNAHIERVPDAGVLKGNIITMHNGVKVYATSYYGSGNLNMLIENRGVHEPQEERAFEAILGCLSGDNITMLELGAYWGFYSLSLLMRHPQARCYLVEPQPFNIVSGQLNFKLNQRTGHFHRAFVSDAPANKPPTIAVDPFCADNNITHLSILHADIQSWELKMLSGAQRMLGEKRVDYVFVSTHSNELHRDCIAALEAYGYQILASADKDETFSYDGLIVAKRPELEEPKALAISSKKTFLNA